jgi:hypothetical protein
LRTGDWPDGKEIAAHRDAAEKSLPKSVKRVYARADSGFYCREAIEDYGKKGWKYILVARKTPRLVEQLQTATWRPSPKPDPDEQCEFLYPPDGWSNAHRFLALRYAKQETEDSVKPEQYQLLNTSQYIYGFFSDRHG